MRAVRAAPSPRPTNAPDTVAYVRVSTEDQARDEKSSLNDQRAAIGVLAARLGRVLADDAVFSDPGRSGQTAEDRPGFMALVAYCQSAPRRQSAPGLVLVLNDSRFGRFRDPDEAAYWRTVLKRAGWVVRFAEGDDTEDLVGRHLLRAIGGAQASAYSAALRANCKRGTRAAAARGLWQNEAPLGYRRLATGGGRPPTVLEPGQRKADDQQVRLTPGPEREQAVVRWAFEAYASGEYSLGSLGRELKKRCPYRKWSRPAVGALLTRPAYVGDVQWCRRPHDKVEREGNFVRPRSEWVIAPDAHPALVSRELFATVASRLGVNKKKRRTAVAGGYPLSGLLTCAQCGRPYVGGGGGVNRKNPDDRDRYRFYKCSGSLADECAGRIGTLIKRFIEPAVIDVIADAVANPRLRRAIAAEIDRVTAGTSTAQSGVRSALERERGELERQRDRAVAAIASGIVTADEAAATLGPIRRRLAEIPGAIERLRFEGRAAETVAEQRGALLAMADDFPEAARQATGIALRDLLAPWIASGVVDKHTRKLTLLINCVPVPLSLLPASTPLAPNSPWCDEVG